MTVASEQQYQRESWLREQYLDSGKTLREIADACGVYINTIQYWMDKFGIERRDTGEVNKTTTASYGMTGAGYMQWQGASPRNGGKESFYVHRLLAVAEYGTEAVAGADVHHRNGVKWDNRPDNIEIVGHDEHAAYHWTRDRFEDYWGDAEYKDEATLRHLYFEVGLSMQAIADRFDINLSTVQYWMDKFEIDRRPRGESMQLAWDEGRRKA